MTDFFRASCGVIVGWADNCGVLEPFLNFLDGVPSSTSLFLFGVSIGLGESVGNDLAAFSLRPNFFHAGMCFDVPSAVVAGIMNDLRK